MSFRCRRKGSSYRPWCDRRRAATVVRKSKAGRTADREANNGERRPIEFARPPNFPQRRHSEHPWIARHWRSPSSSPVPAAQPAPANPRKPLGETIAAFVTGFALKDAPASVVQRARTAFVDTVGVMLAGSQLPPADIVCDVIKLEGSTPSATIVGRSLRRCAAHGRSCQWCRRPRHGFRSHLSRRPVSGRRHSSDPAGR